MDAVSGEVTFVVGGPIRRCDLAGLCARFGRMLAHAAPAVAVCELREVEADAVAVDALARLQLTAQRRGSRVLFRGASGDLRELVALAGLCDVVLTL
jgi:ABC-type transporter Mla MlaB component